jgi:hypothetical protein
LAFLKIVPFSTQFPHRAALKFPDSFPVEIAANDALRIKGVADGRRADDGDGLASISITRCGDEAGGFARGLDDRLSCFFAHRSILIMSLQICCLQPGH